MTKQIIPINEIQNSFIFSFYAYLEISKEQQEDVNMTSVSKYQTHRCSTALFFCRVCSTPDLHYHREVILPLQFHSWAHTRRYSPYGHWWNKSNSMLNSGSREARGCTRWCSGAQRCLLKVKDFKLWAIPYALAFKERLHRGIQPAED